MLAKYEGCTEEEASDKIIAFLGEEEIPELSDQPRVIISAGSFDDQELTSSVLWLRSFAVDISCIELTPYVLPGDSNIILVPKIIIPVPEAREYIIGVEKKQAAQARKAKESSKYSPLWKALSNEFNSMNLAFHTWKGANGNYMKVGVGSSKVHYEWIIRGREGMLDIAIHFESNDRSENLGMLEILRSHSDSIKQDMCLEFDLSPWAKAWATCRFRLPLPDSGLSVDLAPEAAKIMKILIERTWPILEPHIK